jgi:hypothetical protein
MTKRGGTFFFYKWRSASDLWKGDDPQRTIEPENGNDTITTGRRGGIKTEYYQTDSVEMGKR